VDYGSTDPRNEPAERKLVTVLFCDLVGSTALGDQLDPEAFQAVLGAYFDRMRKLSESFGGIVEKFIGDAVVTVFGMPNVHEDDAERAVRCALAMRDALAGLNDTLRPRFGVELSTRIGINTGVAVASAEALATGDVLNTASRFERAALPGEILVGRDTLMLTREVVEYGEPRSLTVEGKTEPLRGWPVIGLATKRTRPRAPFVGRASELETLTAAVERVIKGTSPEVVVVLGEPGIGKSRLVDEFAARTTGRAAVYRGSCVPYGQSSAWSPVVEVVRSEAQILDLDAPDVALRKLRKRLETRHDDAEASVLEAQIGPLLGALRRTAPSGPEMVWALRRYLEGLAREGPLVFVLENVQWAAQTLVDTLLELAETIAGVPLLVVCVGRAEMRDRIAALLGQARTTVVLLDALSDEQSRSLVANLHAQADDSWDASLQELIASRGQGNPLFIEEIAAMAAEEGAAGGIPHSLQALISARLDLLPTEAKRAAQCAAAIGDAFWDAAVWALASGEGEAESIATALRMLRTRGFVEEEPVSSFLGTRQFRFHHALLREVAYDSIAKRDRFRLHRLAAEWLDDRASDRAEFFPAIAHHFNRTLELAEAASPLGPQDDPLVEAALASFVRAGHQASGLVAHEDAARWYERALHALDLTDDDPALRCSLLLSLGEVRLRAGERVTAREAFTTAAAIARRDAMPEQLARAAIGIGGGQTFDIPAFTVDSELVAVLEEALEALGPEDGGMRARVLGRLAVALYFSEDREGREQMSLEAVDIARRVGDNAALAYALSARRFALWGPEAADERLEVATEIISLAESIADRDLQLLGHRWRIVTLLELGDTEAVWRQIDSYATIAEELKQPYQLWFAEVFRAMRASLEGQLEEAESMMHRALDTGSRVQGEHAVQFFAAQLLVLRDHQGRLHEMEPAIRAYAEQFPTAAPVRAALAFILADMGKEDESRSELEVASEGDFANIPRDTTWLLTLSMLARTAATVNDLPRAQALYDQFEPYADHSIVTGPAIVCLGAAARYLGLLAGVLGRREDAERHFNQAIELNTRMGARPYLAHTLREYGEMLLRIGGADDRDRALDLLESAARIYRTVGMRSFGDRTTFALREAGSNAPEETE
jgi:class 3 adenylate cyclase/tetratricopeptide (TPR) repeat protein